MSGVLYQQGLEYVNKLSSDYERISGVPKQELEEAGVEGVLSAVKKYRESKGGFAPFVKSCIIQSIKFRIKIYRRKNRRLVSLTDLPEKYQPATKDTHHRSNNASISGILDKASREERKVLKMVMDGFTQSEIAEILGLSRRTIVSIISNVRQKCQP